MDEKFYGEEKLSFTSDGTCHEFIPPSINNNSNSIQPAFIDKERAPSNYPLSL